VKGRDNGLISFGIATAVAVGALLVLGGRLAISFNSPSTQTVPLFTKQKPAESLRATSQIAVNTSAQTIPLFTKPEPAKPFRAVSLAQDSAPSSAVERKPKASRPMIRLSSVPSADPRLKVQMPATVCAIETKADRKKRPGGFRLTVARIATKVFSVGRKKKVDNGLGESS
jgi:hypothetical protein